MSQITIIGLGLIGTSIGLALKQNERNYVIMGHDKSTDAAAKAKKRGVVDKTNWNLINACEEADLIILAIPAGGIAPTLEALKDDLKPGSMVMDTATIKVPIIEAAKVLPNAVHFVGSNPILISGAHLTVDQATPGLFTDIPWALCPTPETDAAAISVASDFVTAIGASPVFLDPTEHDGLMAAVDGMPTVLAAAVLGATSKNPAWREIRHMAGNQFGTATYLPDFESEDLTAAVTANNVNVAQWLDLLIDELQGWKADLQTEDTKAINERFEQAIDRRSQWLAMRARGDWDEPNRPEDSPSFWKRLFLGGGRG